MFEPIALLRFHPNYNPNPTITLPPETPPRAQVLHQPAPPVLEAKVGAPEDDRGAGSAAGDEV